MSIEQHRATVGHHRLRLVQRVVLYASAFEHRAHVVSNTLILVHCRGEYLCKCEFCDVILRGTQSARENHHLALRKGSAESLLDLLGGVAY